MIYTMKMKDLERRLSVAPMMDWTDRHCRYFLRGFSPHALLYTENDHGRGHPPEATRTNCWPTTPRSIQSACN